MITSAPPIMRAISSSRSAPSSRDHCRQRPPLADCLGDAVVRPAVGGDLRQVRDAEHLEPVAERAAAVRPTTSATAPADAGVHLVEDQRLARRVGGRERLERQHDPRQLAARRDARQGPQVLAGIRRDVELRLVDARAPSTVASSERGREPDLAPRARHGQIGERPLERPANAVAALAPARRDSARRVGQVRRPAPTPASASSVSRALRRVLERRAARAPSCGRVRDDVVQRRAVLLLQTLEQCEAILDLLQPRRRRVDARGIRRAGRTPGLRAAT